MAAAAATVRPLPLREMNLADIRGGFQPGPPCEGDGVEIDTFSIPGPVGPVTVRRYVSAAAREAARTAPVILYFHGGGWVMGTLAGYDCLCRPLAVAAEAVVLSVDYSLAPERRFPTAVEECFSALCAAAEAYEISTESTAGRPLVVAGDSAGGNLAAAVALMSRDRGGPPLELQLLIYPVLDCGCDTPSYHENAEGYLLTRESMLWFWEQYLAHPDDGLHAWASPLLAPSLQNLPAAHIITCEFDPLRDEGEQYAERLLAAGVPAEFTRIDGMIHGFLRHTDVIDTARETIQALGDVVRRQTGR